MGRRSWRGMARGARIGGQQGLHSKQGTPGPGARRPEDRWSLGRLPRGPARTRRLLPYPPDLAPVSAGPRPTALPTHTVCFSNLERVRLYFSLV